MQSMLKDLMKLAFHENLAEMDCERIQGVINLADTLYHLCQLALQFQHERVEVVRQLSHKTYNNSM